MHTPVGFKSEPHISTTDTESNPQPCDLESKALPVRHHVKIDLYERVPCVIGGGVCGTGGKGRVVGARGWVEGDG